MLAHGNSPPHLDSIISSENTQVNKIIVSALPNFQPFFYAYFTKNAYCQKNRKAARTPQSIIGKLDVISEMSPAFCNNCMNTLDYTTVLEFII